MMAGKGDAEVNDARKPAGGTGAFDGGIATTDVQPVWRTEALPDWVVHHLIPLLTAGQSWPEGSESRLWELRVEYVKLMNLLIGTLDPTSATVQTLNGSLQSPAKPVIFKRLAKLYDDKAGVVAKAQESFSYARMVDNFARETQYTKLSINVAFWIAVIAAFTALIAAGFFPLASLMLRSAGVAGGSRIALLMQRLALAAARSGAVARSGQISRLAGAGAGRFLNGALAVELFEEIGEELLIDVTTQIQQIKMGTRDTVDWRKVKAAAIGAGAGAIAGTKLGEPMSRFANDLPGITRLNRMAGDKRGVGNAFLRFPGRALNTGLNNMFASPAGSIVANYVVYDQFALPGAEGFYGGFLSGAGRTNTLAPTNLHVLSAVATPVTSLSRVFAAAAAQRDTAPITPGPFLGDLSPRTDPPAGSPDAGPLLPQPGDPSGGTRRDRTTSTITQPAPPGHKPTRTTPTTEATPDTSQAPRPRPADDAEPRLDSPAPPAPARQSQDQQDRPQDQQDPGRDARPASPPGAQDTSPTGDQQPAPTTDQPPAGTRPAPTGSDTTAPDTTGPDTTGPQNPAGPQDGNSAPDSTPSGQDTTGTPDAKGPQDTTGARDTAGTSETNNTPGTPGNPDTAGEPARTGEPRSVGEPHSARTPDPAGTPQDAATPGTLTTAQTSAILGTAPRPQTDPAPAEPGPQTDTPGPALVARLIGRARNREVSGRPLDGTRFMADLRERGVPVLTVAEARAAFEVEVQAADLGREVTGLRWTAPDTLVVEVDGLPDQTFTFEVGRVSRGRLGRTVVQPGNVNQVRLTPGVAPDQVARLVLHEIVDTLHARSEPRQNLMRRLITRRDGHDECLTARRRELEFLNRRIGETSGDERAALVQERAAVHTILEARGLLDGPSADPAPVQRSANDLVGLLLDHDQAVDRLVRDLDQALSRQVDRLLRVELDLQLQAMTVTDMGTGPLLTAVSQARAAYETVQSLAPAASAPGRAGVEFARALQEAHRLRARYEEQADRAVLVPTLPEAPGPDALSAHSAALRAAAAELTDPARRSPGTEADRRAAADSAVRAADTYQVLLDETRRARRILINPPHALASQLLRLGATHEEYYRQLTSQEHLANARGAQDIDGLLADLLQHASDRRAAALALRTAIEGIGRVVTAQRAAVRAYNDAASGPSVLAADALRRHDLEGARRWRATAAALDRIAAQHEAAERLAIAARDAHQELTGLLNKVLAGEPVDHATLSARADAATTAMKTYQDAIAALPPATPPPFTVPAPPPTALSELSRTVEQEERRLEEARRHDIELRIHHQRQAEAAWDQAENAWAQAALHREREDDSAVERARREMLNAEVAATTYEYHARAAERYATAAAAADPALDASGRALAALSSVNRPDSPRTPEVEAALRELRSRSDAYDAARRAALPSPHALLAAYAAGPIANLAPLTALVNDMLSKRNVPVRFGEEELRWAIRQAFHSAVSPDGLLLRLNATTGAELRIRLTLDDLMEVARPAATHSETMLGNLPQGGGKSTDTTGRSRGFSFDRDIIDYVRRNLRDSSSPVLQFIAAFGVLRVKVKTDAGDSFSTWAQENWQGGNVEDDRGMATMFTARAAWNVELHTASGAPLAESLPAGEAERQSLWISQTYLRDPPANLLEAGRRSPPFPEHVVTGLTGLRALAELLMSDVLSPVARDQIITLMTEDLPSNLGVAINDPAGLRRTITVNGRIRGLVTVRTTVLPGATLVGGPSKKHHQERLRNGFSQAGQSRSDNRGRGGGGSVGLTTREADQPVDANEGEFTVGGERGGAASTSDSVTSVAIHPSVQRWAGETQGYLLNVVHTVTVQMDGNEPVTFDSDPSTGLFRIPEPDAYHYGLPVAAAAQVGHDADGNVVLRGEPVKMPPPGRVDALPTWSGRKPGQLRGVGPGLVQRITGMDQVRAEVEAYLRREGVLPRLRNGVPQYSTDASVRASQMANEQLVAEQFSAERLETGYDQAAQAGLIVNLVHHRPGLAAEHYTLRISLRQDFDNAVYTGVTSAEPVVNLNIGSDTDASPRNRASSRSGQSAADVALNDLGPDPGAFRTSAGVGEVLQSEQTTGSTVNQVKLLEGSGQSAVFRIPHTLQVERLTGANTALPVVTGQAGEARIVLPADLLPPAPSFDGYPRPAGPRHPTSRSALRLATVAHLDVGDLATAVANMLAKPLDRSSPAFQHLAAFFNVRSLISHPEVFTSGHRTGVDTQSAAGRREHQPVDLHLRPGESRFLTATDLLVGDINLTLGSHSSSTRRSIPWNAGGSRGESVPGGLDIDGSGGLSGERTTTHERKLIAGPERLTIDTGKQYAFVMDVAPKLSAGSGITMTTAEPRGGTVLYLLAERDALDLYASEEVQLPLHQLADAAERLMNGDLKLGRRVAVRFMDKYLRDLAEARAAHPSGVPGLTTLPGVPLSWGHSTGRVLAALLALFPSHRLAEMMPPGVPPGQPGETDAETRERMLSRPEFFDHVREQLRAAARRLENGEVAAALAPTYQDAVGMSTVKGVTLHPEDRPGVEVELLEEIRQAVDAVAPGAFDADTSLWRALTTDFSGTSWLGKIDTLLDPDSPPAVYPVRGEGTTDILEITVRAELGENARYRGEVFDLGQILQLYTMREENVSESSRLTATPSAKGPLAELPESGSANTSRGRGATGASNLQETRLQRAASFAGARTEVRQDITLVVSVRRVSSTPATKTVSPLKTAVRRAHSTMSWKAAARSREVTRRMTGTIDRLIPPGMVAPTSTAPRPAAPDPRPFPPPENFIVESTRANRLPAAVERHLRRTLNLRLSRADSDTLARLLTGNNRNAGLELMTAADGLMVLEVPMRHGRTARVHVGAVLSEPVTIAQGREDFEIGQADRRQWSTGANTDRTRLLPAGFSFGSGDMRRWLPFAGKFGMGGSYRNQGSDGMSIGGGNRRETSVFEKADSGSIRFRVDYTVRVEVSPPPNSEQTPPAAAVRVATGHADVTLFDHVMRELAEQAENPRPVAGEPGRAAAVRPVPVSPDAQQATSPYEQLRQAQLVARNRNENVSITVRPPHGPPLTYLATPDGRLVAQEDDGGFGRRFAGLPSPLIATAEQHGIDLRALHDRTMPRPDANPAEPAGRPERQAAETKVTSLAEQLRNELNRRGVLLPEAPATWPVKGTPDDTGEGTGGTPRSTHGSPIPHSGFVADGRPAEDDDLTYDEARESFNREVLPEDFGGVGGAWRVVWHGGDTLTLESDLLGRLHFRFQVGPVQGGYLGETTATNTGTQDDPHVVTLAPRVARDQVARLVLHEISDVLQYRMEGEHGHSHPHTPGEATRDECVTARRNELVFLERKQREALAAGDTAAANRLGREIVAVQDDLDRRTRPRHRIDDLINGTDADEAETQDTPNEPAPEILDSPSDPELAALGIRGEPEPLGANVFKVRLADGSHALLLEESTRQGRNVTLLMTQLAHRLDLVGPARAAGDRHILIDWTPTAPSSGFLGTREAVLAGYLAALADVRALVTRPALHVLPSSRPLRELFLREDASGRLDWGRNPLSPSDVRALAAMLEAARPDFEQMGLLSQFELIVERHWNLAGGPLARNAVGLESALDTAPGHHLPLSDVGSLRAMDTGSPTRSADTDPAAEGQPIDAALRLHSNIRQGVVSSREWGLGSVVTFADGSQALTVPIFEGEEILVRALLRQALGLAGPAVELDEDGYVWRTFGNDALRASLATGVTDVIDVPGSGTRTTEVVFGDGRRALRHEFPNRTAADEHEARLEEAREARGGLPGSHRATPYVLYEEIVRQPEPTAESEARLATRALYTFLSLGRPLDHATLRRLLDANPLLVRFGEAGDWEFRTGAPVLSARDVARLAAAFEALRGSFARYHLGDRHERLLSMLNEFAGSDDARLIPLAFSEAPTTVEYRTPVWRPTPGSGPILGELLQGDRLAQVNARNQADVILRADAELAARPEAEGHVFARVPADLFPKGIRPGEEFTVNTLLDGVDDAGQLAESPHGTRVTILASEYVPVGDLSGKPHQALFRPGARFEVTAKLTTDEGETHYFLTQQPARPRTGPVVTPRIRLTGELALDVAGHVHDAFDRTPAGLRFRSGVQGEAARHTVRPVKDAFVVEGRYSARDMVINGRLLGAEVVAAMLLCSGYLPDNDVLVLAGPHDGTTTFAQDLARYTGRVVLAADGPVETTTLGTLRVTDAGRSSGQFRIFLPADTSAMVAEQLRAWLDPTLAQMMDAPRTRRTLLTSSKREAELPSPMSVSPGRLSGAVSTPPLSGRHRELIFQHRFEVSAGIWYRDQNSAVMPTADPRLLRRSNNVIDVGIAGDGTDFLIGAERLSAADLATMLAHDPRVLAQPNAWIRILGCETARNQAVLQELADITGRWILASNEIVYIGADRRPHTAAVQGYGSDGRPVFPQDDNGEWLRAQPATVVTPPGPLSVPAPPAVQQRGLSQSLFDAALAADPNDWEIFAVKSEDGVAAHLTVDGVKVVKKRTHSAQARAEFLSALLGQLIGADVPIVALHPTDPEVVFMTYVEGAPLDGVTNMNTRRGAILIELLDLLIVNDDRHKENLFVTKTGIAGIDHGRAFALQDSNPSALVGKVLKGNFVARRFDDSPVWVDNPLSRQDMDFLTDVMMSLLPLYQELGFHEAFDMALDRLYHIGMHAKGEISLLTPSAPAPTRVQHHFGWDHDAHNQVVEHVHEQLRDGVDVASVVPYMTSDAMHVDVPFGAELEYAHTDDSAEGDSDFWRTNVYVMTYELHRAGLVASPVVFAQHDASMRGLPHMEWEAEKGVSGEFVSGILRDTEQTWADLVRTTEIIRSCGGTITMATGGHVTIGTPNLAADVRVMRRLVTLYHAYEDILFRLGQDPRRPDGMHRPYKSCMPNELVSGDRPTGQMLRRVHKRPSALNLSHVNGDANDRVEFRHADGHLDPPIIQVQIKLGAAIVDYAYNGGEHLPAREPLGTHWKNRWSPRQDAASFIDMVNLLFPRREDKEQLTALYAITSWQPSWEDRGW
ncbi:MULTISPECIES: hypothetical protein [unclassified Nonomuraea]|uniref:WXG100-like domain-containing protein n=1 Tax=unclassified Nonomuraea TaxID=2593643 RepID=UPI003405EC08